MSTFNEVKGLLIKIKKHFLEHIENKYIKNYILRIDIPSSMYNDINKIIDHEFSYFDSNIFIEDLYRAIYAFAKYINILRKKLLPEISKMDGSSYLFDKVSGTSFSQQDRVIQKMVIKNYPMNLKIFTDMINNLYTASYDYDIEKNKNNPILSQIKELNDIGKYLVDMSKNDETQT